MHRRDFLKIMLATPIAEFIDYEKLLWIPDEKKIFILPEGIQKFNLHEIFEMEMIRIGKILPSLFERDNTFYHEIMKPHYDWEK